MSRESRAKQWELLKLDRPFFNKSLVRSFSSLEIPLHRLGDPPDGTALLY